MSKSRQIAFMGMLYAVAVVLSIAEGWLAPLLALPPGMKLGLSNVAVMYALYFLGLKEALLLGFLKAAGIFITRGPTGAALSLAGGLLSIGVMYLFVRMEKRWGISQYTVAVAGAVAHNIGQLLAVSVLLGSQFAWLYLPVLLVSGVVTGLGTGALLKYLIPALRSLSIHPAYKAPKSGKSDEPDLSTPDKTPKN